MNSNIIQVSILSKYKTGLQYLTSFNNRCHPFTAKPHIKVRPFKNKNMTLIIKVH